MGDMLMVKDIQVDASKYEIVIDGEIGVASVSAPRVVEEPTEGEEGEAGEEGEEGATEPEVINEKKEEDAE
jgi:hypothetical protein